MGFWIVAVALGGLVGLYIGWPLVMARRSARTRAAHDAQVFRDQLAEIDRDVERGVLSAEEAEGARIEISRRLIAASEQSAATPDHPPAPRGASFVLAALLLAGAPLGGWAIYAQMGAPGLPDQPLAARFDAARVPQEIAELRMPPPPPPPPGAQPALDAIAEIRARFAEEGPEARGLFVLGQAYAEIGRYDASWRAYAELRAMTDAEPPVWLLTAQAESMILAAGGYVSPEAEDGLAAALARAPETPIARYYMGLAHAQNDRPQQAVDLWAALLRDSPPDAPWRGSTRAQLDEVVARAGLAPPDLPDPTAPTEAEQRAEMLGLIRRMDARLSEQGGGPQEWAQLARSYAAVGEAEAAAEAESRARAALAGDAEALAAFEAALAGLAEPEAPALRNPTAEEMAAAAEMTDEDRRSMIRGMVEGLRERLLDEGGRPEEWARLITALGVLGEPEAAQDALTRALDAHGDDPATAETLRETARSAGVADR